MIVDSLENIIRYKNISRNFGTAVSYFLNTNLYDLCPGKFSIDGESVYAFVEDNWLDRSEPQFEMHDRYADIQVILRGSERFALGTGGEAEPDNLNNDFRVCNENKYIEFALEQGQFVIFFPGEHHSPNNPVDNPAMCRKLVIKVLF